MWPAGQSQGRAPPSGGTAPAKPSFQPQQTPPQHVQAPAQSGGQQARYNQTASYSHQVPNTNARQGANSSAIMNYVEDDDDDMIEPAKADDDQEEDFDLTMAREFGKTDRANIQAKRAKLKALAAPVPLPLTSDDLAEMLAKIEAPPQRAAAERVTELYKTAMAHLKSGAAVSSKRTSSIRFGNSGEPRTMSSGERPTSTLGIILGEGPENKCMIHDIVPGSPAYSSNKLRRGDAILRVDEQEVDRDSIVRYMRGSDMPGTYVTLQVSRPGRKRPFEVNLCRAANDVVTKKRTLHDNIVQLGHLAASPTERDDREGGSSALVNDILHLVKQIDREQMEGEAILMGDIIEKDNAIRMMQGDLVEFVRSQAGGQVHHSSDPQQAAQSAGRAPRGTAGGDEHALRMLAQGLERIDKLQKFHCDAMLTAAQPRLEFLDGAVTRIRDAVDAVTLKLPGAGGATLSLDKLQQSLLEASDRIQELSIEVDNANAARVAAERQLKELEQRNSFSQLSLTAATSDYRRTKAELRLLQEELSQSRAGGARDAQAQVEVYQKIMRQGEEEREKERESMQQTLTEAAERQAAREMESKQLREDMRNMQAALDAAKRREWELELSVNQHLAQHKHSPSRTDGSEPSKGGMLEAEVQNALGSLREATAKLREKEELLNSTTRMLEEERRKVAHTRGENTWLTKQLGTIKYGAAEESADLLAHFETRLAELEDLSAQESIKLEELVCELTQSVVAVESCLRSSTEMAAEMKERAQADGARLLEASQRFSEAEKQAQFDKEVLEVELSRWQERYNDSEERNARVIGDKDELRATVAEKDGELQALTAGAERMSAKQEELQKAVAQLTAGKEVQEREAQARMVQVEQLQAQIAVLEDKGKEWKQREAGLVKLLEDVELKSERMVMIVEETEKEKATVQERLDEAERRLAMPPPEDPNQRELIERLRKDVAHLGREKDDWKQKRDVMNDRWQEAKREREEMSRAAQQLEGRLRAAELEREVLENKVAGLCLQMEERVARLEQSEDADAQPSAEAAAQKLQASLREREERLRQAEHDGEAARLRAEAAQKQLAGAEEQRERAEARVAELGRELDAAAERAAEAEASVVDSRGERDLAVAGAERLREALAEAEQQRDEKLRNGDELSRLLAEARARTRESQAREEAEAARCRRLERERDDLAEKASALSTSLSAAVEEKEGALKKLSGAGETESELKECKTELEACKEKGEGLQQRLDAAEVANRLLQSKLSMVAVRVRQQEVEISLALVDASDTGKDLARDLANLEAKVKTLQLSQQPAQSEADGEVAQQAELIKALQNDKDRLREQHVQDAAELAKARQRADVAIEELARLRKDNLAHQSGTEEIATLRQRNARLEKELKESVGLQLEQLQERLMMTDRGLREEGDEADALLERVRVAEARARELQAELKSEKGVVEELQALKKDTSDERQVLIGELQAAAEDVRAANLRAAGAQARMEHLKHEVQGRHGEVAVGGKTDDGRRSPPSSAVQLDSVEDMRKHVLGLEEELRAERSSHESNLQKLMSERDHLAALLKSQADAGQTGTKREGDIGSFFQSFFAPRTEPPRPSNQKPPPLTLPAREALGSPLSVGSARARPLPPHPGTATANEPQTLGDRDQGGGGTSLAEPATQTTSTPSPSRTIIM